MADRLSPPREADCASLPYLLFLLASAGLGALLAAALAPAWLPGLSRSLLEPEPKAFWYLSRASGWVAYVMLWLSMASGLSLSNRLARAWPGGPKAFDLHQTSGLLGLGLATFHGLILLGDRYIGYDLAQLLTPFSNAGYRPLGVELGQVAFYFMVLVGLTYFARRAIGPRLWRAIHALSYLAFVLALAHGLISGTDSGGAWAALLYWGSGASLLFLTTYRVLARALAPRT